MTQTGLFSHSSKHEIKMTWVTFRYGTLRQHSDNRHVTRQ